MAGDNGLMPDNNLYILGSPDVPQPSPSDYQVAFDPADKNTASPNDAVFQKAMSGNANVSINAPIENQNTVVRDVPVFDFKKAVIFGAVLFLGYKLYKKGKV